MGSANMIGVKPVVKAVYGRCNFLYTVDGARINAVNVVTCSKISNAIIRAQVIQTRLDEFK